MILSADAKSRKEGKLLTTLPASPSSLDYRLERGIEIIPKVGV